MKLPVLLGALALACAPALALAQPKVQAPANFVPAQGVTFGALDGTATFVDATHPLPVTGGASGVTLSVKFAATVGTTWTAITPSTGKAIRRVADATGGNCVWTARTSGQVAGEGVPFSLAGSPGSDDLGGGTLGAISIRCASSVLVTVDEG